MKNQERAKDGKFKRKEPEQKPSEGERGAAEHAPLYGKGKAEAPAAEEEERQPRLLTKVTGQSTTAAKLQSHNLKWKDGEPQPEFIGEQPPTEGEKENEK